MNAFLWMVLPCILENFLCTKLNHYCSKNVKKECVLSSLTVALSVYKINLVSYCLVLPI